MPLFSFPDDAVWNDAADAVSFEVQLGDYRGQVFVPLRVITALVGYRPTAAQALQHFHLNRALFERAAEIRLAERRLDDDANVHLTGSDVRRAAAAATNGSSGA
ncbi:MAG: DUF1488 family protein [Azospirillaceae bacterium]|nr:DUF1488 family protein [Azospirillaceae bacterium]